jgi:hypothetical protein
LRVLNDVHNPLAVAPLLAQSLARTTDALVRADRVGDPTLLFWAAEMRAQTAAHAGDIDEMDRCLEIEASLVERLNQPMLSYVHIYHRAKRAQIAGDTALAEKLATEALRIGTESGQPDATTFWGTQLVVVSNQRGTMGEMVPIIEQMASEVPGVAGVLTAALARGYAEVDRTDDARRLLEDFATADFYLIMDNAWFTGMACYAEAAIAVGDPRYAGPLIDRLAPWAGQLVTTGITTAGPVSAHVGGLATILGRYDEADAYFAQSSAMCDRMGAKFFAARTHLWWGKMLAERMAPGDKEKSCDLLTVAHTAAAANGYANVERRAAAALELMER